MIPKLVLIPVLIIIACLFAGVFGVIHNQISYTVSPDYFHAFKFIQFHISPSVQNRIGASMVGFLASWWMGVCIGLPVVLISLIHNSWQEQLKVTFISYVWVILTGMLFAIMGLVWGFVSLSPNTLPAYPYPVEVVDKVAFTRAGYMHNASYLGGIVGIIVGCIYQVYYKYQADKKSLQRIRAKRKFNTDDELGLDLSLLRGTAQSKGSFQERD